MNSRNPLAWSPPVRLWLLASVQSAWFGPVERFPRTPALLQPWREYQQVMLRTRTTGALPMPGSVLGHGSGTSYVNKTLIKAESALCIFIPSLLGILLIIFLLSVQNLGIIKPAETVRKQNKMLLIRCYETRLLAPFPLQCTLLQLSRCKGGMNMQYSLGVKKKFLCDANDWQVNNWFPPLQGARRNPQPPSLLWHDVVGRPWRGQIRIPPQSQASDGDADLKENKNSPKRINNITESAQMRKQTQTSERQYLEMRFWGAQNTNPAGTSKISHDPRSERRMQEETQAAAGPKFVGSSNAICPANISDATSLRVSRLLPWRDFGAASSQRGTAAGGEVH